MRTSTFRDVAIDTYLLDQYAQSILFERVAYCSENTWEILSFDTYFLDQCVDMDVCNNMLLLAEQYISEDANHYPCRPQ